MNKQIVLLFTLTLLSVTGIAAPKGLGAYLSHASFNIPGEEPYLETYLEILGNTIVYKQNASGLYQGSIQVTIIIRQDSIIRDFRKYELFSPEVTDTAAVGINFIDQQRFVLSNGNYMIDLSIADMNINKKPVVISYPVSLDFPSDNFSTSGIQLINSYTKTTAPNPLSKSGYDFIPFVDNFFPSDKNKLTFYAEIYNPLHKDGSEEKYLISAFIESFESRKMLNEYIIIRKEPSKSVTVVLSEFDITRLPSGNYNLVISLRNRENKVLTQNVAFFQRSNPGIGGPVLDLSAINFTDTFADKITATDSLREFIRSLQPIATELESIFIKSQTEIASADILKQFFLNFWQTRDELNPGKAWEKYKFEVLKVNNAYSTQVKKGYSTDMGRVYLRYGPPNTISDRPFETAGYEYGGATGGVGGIPYQIWHYYSLNDNRERNRKFVFIASELGVKDYTLVHSDASGEIQNYNWQNELDRLTRNKSGGTLDADQLKRDRSNAARNYFNPW